MCLVEGVWLLLSLISDQLQIKAANKLIQDIIIRNNNKDGTSDSLLGLTYMKYVEIMGVWMQD